MEVRKYYAAARHRWAAVLFLAGATALVPSAQAGIVGVNSSTVQAYTVTLCDQTVAGNPACPGAALVQPIAGPDTFTPLFGAPAAAALAAATPNVNGGQLPGVNFINGLGGVPFVPGGANVGENLDGVTIGTGAVGGGFIPNFFGFNTSFINYIPPTFAQPGLLAGEQSAYVILMSLNFNIVNGVLPTFGISQIVGTCTSAAGGNCLVAGGVAEYDPNGVLLGGTTFSTGTQAVAAGVPTPFANTQIVLMGGTAATGLLQEDAFLILEGDPMSIDIITDSFVDQTPEPASFMLLGSGIGLVAWFRRRRK